MTDQQPPAPTIPPALAALPQMLADGNLPLIRQALDNGDLASLSQYLTGEQMREFDFAVRAGDIEAARNVVAGVEVPGVGVLWPKKSNPWPIVAIVVVVLILLGVGAWLLFGGSDDKKNIPDTLAGDSNYSTFTSLLTKSGLDDLLSQTGPYTVFAPDNKAFEALPKEQLDVLETDNDKLRQVVQYHIATGEISSEDLPSKIKTADDGAELTVEGSGSSATINGTAKIIDPDVEATNGVIHGIDAVLLPPGLDLTAPPSENIVQVVSNNPNYSTLANLLNTAGLSETLSGAGPFTLFAPNNAAFDALPEEQLAALAANPTQLRTVLNYHVTAGDLPSSELTTKQVNSLEGASLDIVVSGGNVTVNGAEVVDPDMVASNGVVHGINRVLIPPGVDLTTTTSSTETTTTTTSSTTTTTAPTTSSTDTTTTSTDTTTTAAP